MTQTSASAPAVTTAAPTPREVVVDRTRVTVVLPTYNRKESLRRCVEALLRCEAEGVAVDVRVVDDGSVDGTAETVEELRRDAPEGRSVLYHSQRNQGPSAARNLAIAAADTDLILFIDDDCVPDTGWIRALLSAPWEDGIGAVGGTIVAPAQGSRVSRYCRHIGFNEFPPADGKIRFVNTANSAYLRRALEEVGGLEERVSGGGEDQDLSWRVVLAGYGMIHQPDAVVYHYHREDLRTLARTFWIRGYRNAMKRVLWEVQPPPTWKRLRREAVAFAGLCLRLFTTPGEAARLRKAGVAAGDALPFALLDWLKETLLAAGKLTMMLHLLTGRQTLERSSHRPDGTPDPTLFRRRVNGGGQ